MARRGSLRRQCASACSPRTLCSTVVASLRRSKASSSGTLSRSSGTAQGPVAEFRGASPISHACSAEVGTSRRPVSVNPGCLIKWHGVPSLIRHPNFSKAASQLPLHINPFWPRGLGGSPFSTFSNASLESFWGSLFWTGLRHLETGWLCRYYLCPGLFHGLGALAGTAFIAEGR